MTSPTSPNRPGAFDPVRYKADQRRGWGRAARGWERWWETFERAAQQVSDRPVELARIQPGQRVLDLATGIGEPAVTAARRVGPAGRVLAVDQSQQMLAVARRRMASLGLTNIEFLEADMEALDLDQRFDAILSRWGLMFLPALDAALVRVGGLLLPGGRLAAAVWGGPRDVPLIALAREVLLRELAMQPQPGMPTPFDLADPVALTVRLQRAGFEKVSTEWRIVTFEFDSTEEYARFVRECSSTLPAFEELSPDRQAEVWAAVGDAARRYADDAGRLRMGNACLLVSGARPAAATVGTTDAVARTAELSSAAHPAGAGSATSGARPDEPGNHTTRRHAVRCPFCGGTDTRLESLFGSTLGFSQYWCERCRTVFEYLKWEEPPAAG